MHDQCCSTDRTAALAAALLGSAIGSAALAQDINPDSPHAVAQFVSERSALVAGELNHVGVTITMDPGWYIYWSDETDGLPTTVQVEATDGVIVGDPVFPTPMRHTLPGGILDYTYPGEVTIILPVSIPAEFDARAVSFQIDAQWLVCNDVCLPGGQELEVSFPVVASSDETTPSADARDFARTRARLPKPLESAKGMLDVAWQDGVLQIDAKRGGTLRFFPYADAAELDDLLRTGESKTGGLTLTPADASDSKPVSGIIELRPALGGPARLFEVTAPIGVDPMSIDARGTTRYMSSAE